MDSRLPLFLKTPPAQPHSVSRGVVWWSRMSSVICLLIPSVHPDRSATPGNTHSWRLRLHQWARQEWACTQRAYVLWLMVQMNVESFSQIVTAPGTGPGGRPPALLCCCLQQMIRPKSCLVLRHSGDLQIRCICVCSVQSNGWQERANPEAHYCLWLG